MILYRAVVLLASLLLPTVVHGTTLALYSAAPFSVQITSSVGFEDSAESIRSEINILTSQFLESALSQTFVNDLSLPALFQAFVTVDLRVSSLKTSIEEDTRRTLRRLANDNRFAVTCFISLAFTEPDNVSSKPTPDQVREIVNPILHDIFQTQLIEYKNLLQTSLEPVLQNIQSLRVETNVNESEFAPRDTPMRQDGWTGEEITLVCMIVVVVVLMIAVVAILLQRHNKFRQWTMTQQLYNADHAEPAEIMAARRHSQDVVDVLQASDRYLSKHRPDLLEALQSTASPKTSFVETWKAASSPERQGRRYDAVTNPLEYLYGAATGILHRRDEDEQHIPSPPKLRSPSRVSVLTNRLSHMFHSSNTDPSNDNNMDVNRPPSPDGLHKSLDLDDIDLDLEQDEIPDYPFAFQDFPRHDGTPCLIYNEQQRHTPAFMSDEEFQLFLSTQTNNSQDEDDDMPPPIDTIVMDHEQSFSYPQMAIFQENPEFGDQLERLIAMRYKQYERKLLSERKVVQVDLERDISEIEQATLQSPSHQPDKPAVLSPPAGLEELTQDDDALQKAVSQLTLPSTALSLLSMEDPSPTSVIEMPTARRPKRRMIHRRSFSFGNVQDDKPPTPPPAGDSHRRTMSNSAFWQRRSKKPPRSDPNQHVRANSLDVGRSSRHYRSNSTSGVGDDSVLTTHGIYARFV